ncbi:amidohydrolase family protein [Sphingomonas sp. ID1715]|uniref:amidohydrolase family protein n=1 Tax=Sphingomonas sp. ID1715 TaxID=1656898 RepID=UPI0014891C1A|nr:amidohydrolase family protein [Sphingomonas sp. ID1715]NNM75873.1 amidohydrolase family protein [Sphingomonas sp. ID1715]
MKLKHARLILMLLSGSALAQVPKEQLAKPPADARHFVILSTGGKHGDSYIWTAPDGTLMGRESLLLRGQVFETDASARVGGDKMPARMEIRGVNPGGDVGETFEVTGGRASWKSQVDQGSTAYTEPAFYSSVGGPMATNAWFIERLLATPTKSMKLLPGGTATAEKLTTVSVGEGAKRQDVTLWAVSGISNSPLPVWTDAQNRFFGVTFVLGWLPEGYEAEMPKLEAAQTAAMSARMPALAKSLVTVPTTPVVFTNVKLFDADGLSFKDGQTVVVDKGKIVAVGPAASTTAPAGARVIDGRGKTLVPGLWDVHMHVGDDYALLQELSLGVTSVRDPGNNDRLTIDRRGRAASGQLLSPTVYPSSLIDGKGPNTAQVANVATSEAEAIDWVRKAKTNGFNGVKFYGTLNPAWLKPAIDEAHRLGLHVHGHIPQGLRPLDAVNAGYDEITHINWIVMQGMPDSVIQQSNGIMRFEGPGRYAKDLDLDSPEMKAWVKTLADKKIYSDPTMIAFESLYVPENGELSPSYAPFVGTLPPATERGFRSGGFKVPEGLTRADYRKSWAKMVELLGRMHKAGVPVIAGTDGSGLEIIHELEIYREAGFTPAEALAAATIVPARMVGVDKSVGSIAVGKTADLVLVEGDPEARIGDLRQTRLVMQAGRIMDADALRKAAGFAGRPK